MSTLATQEEKYARPCSDWTDFQARWGGLHNFLMDTTLSGELDYKVPSIEELVERVRTDEHTLFRMGVKDPSFDISQIPDAKTMPIHKLMERPFVMAHFALAKKLCDKGEVFEGLEERWVQPWREKLLAHGFTFDNIFSIVFASGPNSATNYHWDFTHQMAFQIIGTKHFFGLKDPDRWTDEKLRCDTVLKDMARPAGVTDTDAYAIVQTPGTVLWNAITTPHWVETFDKPAATLTLVHNNLRLNGQLCPHGEELFNYRTKKAASTPAANY